MATADVVVVGAGAIGLAVAREVAGRGASVVVLERGLPGGGATRASAGILSPTDPHEWAGPLGRFNAAAVAAWPAWAAGLAEEAGAPCGFERRGELRIAPPADPFLAATADGAAAAGWRCEEVDAAAVRALEPGLALPEGWDALHLPDAAAVHTDLLTRALREGCRRRGAVVTAGCGVSSIDVAGRGVLLDDGERVGYGTLVVATGAWLLPPLAPPVRPVLGEALLVRPAPDAPAPLRATLRSPAGSLVPRADGTVWLGTTVLERGFQAAPSLGSVHTLATTATTFVPALAGAPFVEARAGLRPASADGLPLLGPVADDVVLATGHGREGIIHTPPTAALIADGVVDGAWDRIPPELRATR